MSELRSWLLQKTELRVLSAELVRAHDQLAQAVFLLVDDAAGFASQCLNGDHMAGLIERENEADGNPELEEGIDLELTNERAIEDHGGGLAPAGSTCAGGRDALCAPDQQSAAS